MPRSARARRPKRRSGKRYVAAQAQVDRNEPLELGKAVEVLGKLPKAKFDETVEVSLRLGIDPKKSDQVVRGSISLPHGIGKELRVVVFAENDKADEAKAAGAMEVGSAELAKKVQGGWTDFDVAIATPDMMKHVGKLGKVLGPQGKMPSPKAGTVTMDVSTAVQEFKAGKIEFRNDAGANVSAPMGKRSFDPQKIRENVNAFIEHVNTLKPPSAKGAFVVKGALTASQSPGIPLKV
ncbi:MAG: 50S ribosomal protein L1 [Planctomycetes bacterium]|nr:50S ribosomal protein L1 [Planctomycetota bacterium]